MTQNSYLKSVLLELEKCSSLTIIFTILCPLHLNTDMHSDSGGQYEIKDLPV